jgi:hypothetical protein
VKRLALVLLPLLAACRSHDPHRVTDLETGFIHYTKDMRRGLTTGYVYLKDAKTGAEVTVRESRVEEISEDDFRIATGAQ